MQNWNLRSAGKGPAKIPKNLIPTSLQTDLVGADDHVGSSEGSSPESNQSSDSDPTGKTKGFHLPQDSPTMKPSSTEGGDITKEIEDTIEELEESVGVNRRPQILSEQGINGPDEGHEESGIQQDTNESHADSIPKTIDTTVESHKDGIPDTVPGSDKIVTDDKETQSREDEGLTTVSATDTSQSQDEPTKTEEEDEDQPEATVPTSGEELPSETLPKESDGSDVPDPASNQDPGTLPSGDTTNITDPGTLQDDTNGNQSESQNNDTQPVENTTTLGNFEGAIVPLDVDDGSDPDFARIDQARFQVHKEAMRPDLSISSMEQKMIDKARLNSFFKNPDMFPTSDHPSTGP